jgi:hypothetical protein
VRRWTDDTLAPDGTRIVVQVWNAARTKKDGRQYRTTAVGRSTDGHRHE